MIMAWNSFLRRARLSGSTNTDGIPSPCAGWQNLAVCIFLVLAVWAVFGQTGDFQFVNYDDDANVYENPVVEKGLTPGSIPWAFTHPQVANWIPLTTLSHILDCQLFGLRAGGHHLVNVLFHAGTAVLLFLVLRRMTGSLWRSAFVAAVFAVHPLRAESVAWVSERKDVLSGFFFMLTIGAYVEYVEKRKAESRKQRFSYALTLGVFALGLLAKNMVVTLPFVLLLLDYWPLGRYNNRWQLRQALDEKDPFIVLSIASCAAGTLVRGLIITDASQLPLPARIGNALVSCVVYLRQMVFPVGLAIHYPYVRHGLPIWEVGLAFVLLGAISAGVLVWRKEHPYLLVGWLWYLGMLAPVIGLVQISADAAHADRYTYLPEIGLAVAGTWAVGDWSARWPFRRLVLGGLMAAVVGSLMVCARVQTSYWKDSQTLWTRALACVPGDSVVHGNLGDALEKMGQMDQAILHYRAALKINPGDSGTHSSLGFALAKKGQLDEALAECRIAVALDPDDADAHKNFGFALDKKGQLDQAIAQYRKALEIDPDNAEARTNLSNALRGVPDRAKQGGQ
jgi:tetratricopeptide (TPR) repeat protein